MNDNYTRNYIISYDVAYHLARTSMHAVEK